MSGANLLRFEFDSSLNYNNIKSYNISGTVFHFSNPILNKDWIIKNKYRGDFEVYEYFNCKKISFSKAIFSSNYPMPSFYKINKSVCNLLKEEVSLYQELLSEYSRTNKSEDRDLINEMIHLIKIKDGVISRKTVPEVSALEI